MNTVQVKRVVEIVQDFPGLGQRLRQVREQARDKNKRSLSAICRECGISRSYWYQLESEDLRSPATEEIIRKIERALGVDLGVDFPPPATPGGRPLEEIVPPSATPGGKPQEEFLPSSATDRGTP